MKSLNWTNIDWAQRNTAIAKSVGCTPGAVAYQRKKQRQHRITYHTTHGILRAITPAVWRKKKQSLLDEDWHLQQMLKGLESKRAKALASLALMEELEKEGAVS